MEKNYLVIGESRMGNFAVSKEPTFEDANIRAQQYITEELSVKIFEIECEYYPRTIFERRV